MGLPRTGLPPRAVPRACFAQMHLDVGVPRAGLPCDGELACCVLGGPCEIDVVEERVECVGRVKAGPGLN